MCALIFPYWYCFKDGCFKDVSKMGWSTSLEIWKVTLYIISCALSPDLVHQCSISLMEPIDAFKFVIGRERMKHQILKFRTCVKFLTFGWLISLTIFCFDGTNAKKT